MRSMPDDRTARAVIRDEALRLFAAHGPDVTTVRQIAKAARVSPGLVLHHFGSKAGLRDAVDQYVLDLFDAMLGEMTVDGAPDLTELMAGGSMGEMMMRHLPPDSPVPAYLRTMLLAGGDAGRRLFRRLFDTGRAMLDALVAAGMATPGPDPVARGAFLMTNDLAVLLLREHLADVLGADPLSGQGLERWATEMLSVYTSGLLTPPHSSPEGDQE